MNCLALNLKNKIFGASMFLEDKFVIVKDYFDGEFLERTKTLIYKFEINAVVASINLGLNNFDIIKECGIDVFLMDKFIKKIMFPREGYTLSANSLRYLNCYLTENLEGYVPFNDTNFPEFYISGDQSLFKIGYLSVYEIYYFNENNALYYSSTTLMGLNIFGSKMHPNPLIISNKKEITLFSCINACQTTKGANLLKYWVNFPLLNPRIIADRRDVIEFLIRKKINLSAKLKKCKFIDNKRDFIDYGVRKYLLDLNELLNSFGVIEAKLKEVYPMDLICNYDLLTYLDPLDKFIFQPINEQLEELRDIYNNLPNYLDDIAKKVFNEYRIDCSVIYFPQLGYLIETSEELNLNLVFCLEKKFYYKNEFMLNLDKNLGDIKNHIYDVEISVANAFLRDIRDELNRVIEYISIVDCYNSLALAAIKNNWCRPQISYSFEMIDFFGIFHKTINTVNLAKPIVLTGSNGSGKSTLMKNIAYAVILNQIGSFVPSKSARIPIIDKLLTKFCIEEKSSSFLTELMQIEEIIKFSTPDSLILVDELGICTNINEGVSFFLSFLYHNECRYFIASTHFISSFNIPDHIFLEKYSFLYLNKYILENGIYTSTTNPLIEKIKFGTEFMDVFTKIKHALEQNKPIKIKNKEEGDLREEIDRFFEEEE